MKIKVKPKEATAIINSLTSGVVPKIGVQHITVGRSNEVEMVLSALEETKNGHSMMKFWIGNYGSGKSFMLHLLTTVALKQKFVVASADFTPHIRLYSNDGKGQALYTDLMNNVAIQTRPEGGALHILLEKWIEQVIVTAAGTHGISLVDIRSEQYFGLIQNEIIKTVNTITETGGFDFGLAIIKYYEGFIKNDDSLRKNALRWLKGEYTTKIEARRDLGVSDIVNDRNYYDMLKNFCRLFVSIGYSGFVINLDEAVNLFKIANPGMRQRNFEKLLSMYNDCFQGKVEHLFFNVAGTNETLEDDKKGFYSYDALKTRLKINKFETQKLRDYSQPVIRLMPLSHDEIFVLLYNLRAIFNFNYNCELDFSDKDIQVFMEEIYNKPGATEFLTPREVIRDFLNILNILRQNPEADKQELFAGIKVEERTDEHETVLESEEDIRQKKIKRIGKQLKNILLPDEILEKLADILLDDESLLKTVSASFNNEAGTLIATEKRLIFISKRKDVKSFPYGQINEMSYKSGPQYSTLHILLNTENLNIDFIPNSRIKPLIHLLEAQIDIIERKTLAAELKYWEKEIADPDMKSHLSRMSRIAYMIQEKDHTAGETFSMRHTDTVIKLVQQLKAIEVSEVISVEVDASRERIVEALKVTHQAFENELVSMFQADMLEIDAEAMAYKQNLKNRGLINE
ncbi:BREX system ATP-binding domain-containing protein [Bacteroides sp. 51]|uniref:BREX system ATP-binding domain-containing protein n=1 Tax=Bacteroides sp. 51 TaxID=2302938 RepID=UPI0013CF64B5|nr:BREX system ATP-binding domain-containing protein [Bacteroides sp. 51]